MRMGIIALALVLIACKSEHHDPPLELLSSAMETSPDGITSINGELVNNDDRVMTGISITFKIYLLKEVKGTATASRASMDPHEVWSFHCEAGIVCKENEIPYLTYGHLPIEGTPVH